MMYVDTGSQCVNALMGPGLLSLVLSVNLRLPRANSIQLSPSFPAAVRLRWVVEQRKFSIAEKEMIAIIPACKAWSWHWEGQKIQFRSDNAAG